MLPFMQDVLNYITGLDLNQDRVCISVECHSSSCGSELHTQNGLQAVKVDVLLNSLRSILHLLTSHAIHQHN